ncbi:hypothetical protein ACIQVK_42100 [Streptomyces sp. NPDC090493]|uniref:aromatic-ring hydroxylase C-terminal domain-containing protein n=1 Tax=Streptomyces sp. NPDC090493 TaxID=3365964 RepID=UPI0038126DE3
MPGRRREGRTPGGPPGRPAGSGRAEGAKALLIRPDGYIAWSTAEGTPLETALTRWFG